MGRVYVILKLRGLGDLLFIRGKAFHEQRKQSMRENKHTIEMAASAKLQLCLTAPKAPEVCLRKPRLQQEIRSVLGAPRQDKSLHHCRSSMA